MSDDGALRRVLEKQLGLHVPSESRWREIERFVGERSTALGLASPSSYLERIGRLGPTADELMTLATLSTSRHTLFYRDRVQLEAMVEQLALLPARPGRGLRVWSAGCSTGEEPYTLAMLGAERGLDLELLGTDIDAEALRRAEGGRYHELALRQLPRRYREQYFVAEGGGYRVAASLRARVTLLHHNVLGHDPPSPGQPPWDAIVCRNVFIYYQQSVARRTVEWLAGQLVEGGWLFLGASDLIGVRPGAMLQRCDIGGCAAYQRTGAGPPRLDRPPRPRPAPASAAPSASASATATVDTPAPLPLAEQTYQDAMAHLDGGRSDEAQGLLERLVGGHPSHLLGHLSLGNIYLSGHDFQRAQIRYAVCEELAPHMAEVHYLAGVLLRKRGRHDAAARALRRALFLDPDFWPASFLLAGLWMRLGEPARARGEYRQTLRQLARPVIPLQSRVRGLAGLELDTAAVRRSCQQQVTRDAP